MFSNPVATVFFILTVLVYFGNKQLYLRYRQWWLSPLMGTPIVLVALVLLSHTSFEDYYHDSHWLTWLLGPATIAFAIPMYEYRDLVIKHKLPLTVGVIVGCVVALFSCIGLAHLFALPDDLTRSLLPRSISTPFALTVTGKIGGSNDLTSLFVLITGIFGLLFGEMVMALLPLRSRLARGAMFGAASHAAGTAKAREIGNEEGVVACITMMICGIVMVLAAPWLAWLTATI